MKIKLPSFTAGILLNVHLPPGLMRFSREHQRPIRPAILSFSLLVRGTQRPIEAANPVHILPILSPLLLPHPKQLIIPRNLRILGRLEASKAHNGFHLRLNIIIRGALAPRAIDLHLHRRLRLFVRPHRLLRALRRRPR